MAGNVTRGSLRRKVGNVRMITSALLIPPVYKKSLKIKRTTLSMPSSHWVNSRISKRQEEHTFHPP